MSDISERSSYKPIRRAVGLVQGLDCAVFLNVQSAQNHVYAKIPTYKRVGLARERLASHAAGRNRHIRVSGIWLRANAGGFVVDPTGIEMSLGKRTKQRSYERADNKVGNGGIFVLEPRSKGVGPAFTHTTGLGCLHATSTSTLKNPVNHWHLSAR
jgi:hypothetical protein